jgi:hypothetical protein
MINSVKKSGKSKSNRYFLTLYFYKTEKKIFISRKVIRAVTNVMIFLAILSRTFRCRWERKLFYDPSHIVKNSEPKDGLKMKRSGTSARIVTKLFSGVRNAAIIRVLDIATGHNYAF